MNMINNVINMPSGNVPTIPMNIPMGNIPPKMPPSNILPMQVPGMVPIGMPNMIRPPMMPPKNFINN